jgi:hypothetical protein
MEIDKDSNEIEPTGGGAMQKGWRKKFVDQVLGDDDLNHRLLDGNDDLEQIAEELVQDFIPQDDRESQLEEYYSDQMEAARKIFEYYKEDNSLESELRRIKYRWEFMRRSPDYISVFKQQKELVNEESPSINLFKKYEFWNTFGLFCSELPDPELSFEELQASEDHHIADEPFFRINFIHKNFKPEAVISYFTFLEGKIDFNEFNKIEFTIDFSKVTSIDTIKEFVSRLIDDHWTNYHKRVGHRKKPREADDYELILKVGELRDSEELTYSKIAEEIFPEAQNSKSAQSKVSRYYKRYKNLINGGYRTL